MKRLKNLTVSCTYTVGLTDVEVPDEVYEGLASRDDFAADMLNQTDEEGAAFEWIRDNIEEQDAMERKFQVDDMEEADNPDGNPSKTTAS